MTRILRIPGRRAYVSRGGRYTQRFEKARQFPDVTSAARFCRRHNLSRVELLIRTDQPEYDLSIPLSSTL